MTVTRFEELTVWQRAKVLCVDVYRVTRTGTFARDSGLGGQMQRAAVSVMSNIAEGFERFSRAEFRHFLSIARGSAAEVRSQLHLARELGYVDAEQFGRLEAQCVEISRMLSKLRSTLGHGRPDA